MKSTQIALALLASSAQATWPLYTVDVGVHDATAATNNDYGMKPFACLRKGFVWVPNQTVTQDVPLDAEPEAAKTSVPAGVQWYRTVNPGTTNTQSSTGPIELLATDTYGCCPALTDTTADNYGKCILAF